MPPSPAARLPPAPCCEQGELDVITDLITFVEQQQFLAVEGMHRHPASLQERLRARALRLAASKHQLHATAARLGAGLAALQVGAHLGGRQARRGSEAGAARASPLRAAAPLARPCPKPTCLPACLTG